MYRTNQTPPPYSVTTYVRELRVDERERVEGEVRHSTDLIREQTMNSSIKNFVIGVAIALVAEIVALVYEQVAIALSIGWIAGFLLCVAFFARRRALRIIAAAARGLSFRAPSGGWRVEEVEVVARSLIITESGDKDRMTWWLLEVPGQDWFYLDALTVPAPATEDYAASARLSIARLVPNGPILEARWSGDPIPRHDATNSSYKATIKAGDVWTPERDADSCGVVAESSLPAWVRDLVRVRAAPA